MIISLIIFILSALFLISVWHGKKRELRGGQPFIHVGSPELDQKLSGYYLAKKQFLASVDAHYMRDKMHSVAERLERIGLRIAERIVVVFQEFGKAKNRIKDRDMPKNQGIAGFFLSEIEWPQNTSNTPSDEQK